MNSSFSKQNTALKLFTIAFYNLENLFDVEDDEHTLDDDFTADGKKGWSKGRYNKKLLKLGKTIAQIGTASSSNIPSLLGVVEVENERVIQDLLTSPALENSNYSYIHYDSPDERGIDAALIYDEQHFEVLHSEPLNLLIYNSDGERDFTRDILYVKGRLNGEQLHVFVNHWPSRRAGEQETEYKRIAAAERIRGYMKTIETTEVSPNYVIMGDFNDSPDASSLRLLLEEDSLYNPMEKLLTEDRGSANYRGEWSLFDQILVSHNWFNYERQTHSFAHADIFDEHFLSEWKGKYKGNPFRTYVGRKYIGGYSDHFPVYIQLKWNE